MHGSWDGSGSETAIFSSQDDSRTSRKRRAQQPTLLLERNPADAYSPTMEHKTTKSGRTGTALSSALAVSILAFAPHGYAADSLGPSLCAVLKELIPEVKTYRPEGAKAQLVIALAEKYENDELRQVWAQIDQATSASCPKEREAMLGIVKTKSLAEALR
jgi:hypothetical protein